MAMRLPYAQVEFDREGALVEPNQMDAAIALAASTEGGSAAATALSPGAVADLAVVDRDPLTAAEPELRATAVLATLLAGRLTHMA